MGKIATRDKMVEAIKEADKPFVTKSEIADTLGVSWQTIDNNADELHDDPRVASSEAGQATVFYSSDIEEPPEPSEAATGGQHRGPEETGGNDFHLFERAAFYTGYASILFSLLLGAIFLSRATIGILAQQSLSPVIPVQYYGVLAGCVILFAFSFIMLRLIQSGVLRTWTTDLDAEEVNRRVRSARGTGIRWTAALGVGFAVTAWIGGLGLTQFTFIPGRALIVVAATLLVPFLATAVFTATCHILVATSRAYAVYQLVQEALPEKIPEQSGNTRHGGSPEA